MPAPVAGIHVFTASPRNEHVDGRDEPGHDELGVACLSRTPVRCWCTMRLIQQLKADFAIARGALRTLQVTQPIAKNPTRVFPDVITGLAERYGDAPALISARERFSYRELAARSNRYARWARAQGVRKGDVVCLMMPNRPEYMASWIGLTLTGAVVALINTNLSGAALAYSVNVVQAKHVIVASELLAQYTSAHADIDPKLNIWVYGEAGTKFPRIDLALAQVSDSALTAD